MVQRVQQHWGRHRRAAGRQRIARCPANQIGRAVPPKTNQDARTLQFLHTEITRSGHTFN